jgi:hypothetical protein
MVTIRDIGNDIAAMGKQLIDDAEIEMAQIYHWIVTEANTIQAQRTEKQGLQSQDRSGLVMKRFTVLIEEANTGTDPFCGKYITLPHSIYDYSEDRGVDYMTYYYMGEECTTCPPRFSKVLFARTTPTEAHGYYKNPLTEPSKKYPYFYREDDKLWLLGIETIPLTILSKVEVGLLTTLPDVDANLDIDAPFRFPAERLGLLRNRVLSCLRWSLLAPNTKLINDGTESPEGPVQLPQTQSVNNPIDQEP